MSLKTKLLELFKYEPDKDGAQTFNIKSALNDNWDKIEAWAQSVKTALTKLVPTSRTVNGKALSANISLTKADVGLGNVDNTSDANKPISTATQNALNGKANTSHNHSAANITSGTLSVARGGTGQTTLTPAVTTKGVRAIYAGTSDMTAGTTALTTGCIYLVYE